VEQELRSKQYQSLPQVPPIKFMGLPQIKEISKRGKKFRLRKDQHALSAIRDWQNQLEISKDVNQE
jgi:hypothetical protein